MKLLKTYTYSTKKELSAFTLEIKVSKDFKFYFMGKQIPQDLQDFSGVILKQNKFDSFSELNSKILEIISEYETRFVEETKKKVLLYKLDYNNIGTKKEIFFNYLVCYRIDINKNGNIDTSYYEERSLMTGYKGIRQNTLDQVSVYQEFGDKFCEMTWTAEREIWFKNMSDSVENLGNKLLDGFGKHSEVLARKIDQGMLGLLLLDYKN